MSRLLSRRCARYLALAFFLLVWGGLYRWRVKGSPWPGVLALPGWSPELAQELGRGFMSLRAADDEVRRQLAQLPQEERSLFLAASPAIRVTIWTNPIIPKLVALRGSPFGPPPDPEELLLAIGSAWWRTARGLDVVLWTAFVGLCLFAIWSAAASDHESLVSVGRLLMRAPDCWLRVVFAVCVALFGFTLEPPWSRMPASFFLVPALCPVVAILLLAGRERLGRMLKRTALAWALPATGVAFTCLVGLLLELFAPAP